MAGQTELLIASNPDRESRLPYLLRVPLGEGIVLRAAGTWPRTNALYCHPVPSQEWPAAPDIIEQVTLRSCVRRGAAINLVADRARDNRSQLVSLPPEAATRCSGSHRAPANRRPPR